MKQLLRSKELQSLLASDCPPGSKEWCSNFMRYLRAERFAGRKPLFVIGAGVSAGQVPLLSEMAGHLVNLMNHEGVNKAELERVAGLRLLGKRIREGRALRSDAAEFFFSLQSTDPGVVGEYLQRVWRQFTSDLLKGRIPGRGELSYPAVHEAEPTEFHRWVGAQLVSAQAWCLSFNFDRLTAEATSAQAEGLSGRPAGCAVLHTPDEISNYFTAGNEPTSLPAVFKVRGDVFYATCSRLDCPLRYSPLPLHLFLRNRQFVHSARNRGNGLFTDSEDQPCPECRQGSLVLQLSFPGFRAKEEEAFPVLTTTAKYISHRMSVIIIAGLSGRWDDYVLQYLCRIADHWEVPIVDIKPEASHRDNPIADFVRGFEGRVAYVPIDLKADDFVHAVQSVSDNLRIRSPNDPRQPPSASIARTDFHPDGLWLREEGNQLSVGGRIGREAVTLSLDDIKATLVDIVPKCAQDTLQAAAQLGIDNIVIAESSPHNRWQHSMGALTVGLLWFRHLAAQLALPKDELARDEALIAVALLLHDYGHLPFSHLAEQVLDSINWKPELHDLFGSEFNVLSGRVGLREGGEITAPDFAACFRELEARVGLPRKAAGNLVLRLIAGLHGVPWMTAIVNSAVDADKVDYIARDMRELSKKRSLFFGGRIPDKNPEVWLHEFLCEQRVNSHGLLCFDGRSAVALRQLLEERLYLYERLYRTPEVRAAERVAAEFLERFFIAEVWQQIDRSHEIPIIAGSPDLRELKNQVAQDVLLNLYRQVGAGAKREWSLLEAIVKQVRQLPLDRGYIGLLDAIWGQLQEMEKRRDLGYLRDRLNEGLLVGSPFTFPRSDHSALRRIIRPLQHQYACDVLFDLVRFPMAIATPPGLRMRFWQRAEEAECVNVLVPEGPSVRWGLRTRARVPLGEEAFSDIVLGTCCVYIFDPFLGTRPQAYYARDKFIIACKRAGIAPIEQR